MKKVLDTLSKCIGYVVIVGSSLLLLYTFLDDVLKFRYKRKYTKSSSKKCSN